MTIKQVMVAKCEENEINNVQDYLQTLEDVVDQYGNADEEDADANKRIAHVAKKYPDRAFLLPVNLRILLDNYQDKEPDILQHPKWIVEMIELFRECDKYLSDNKKNYIGSGSVLHNKIKHILKDE